MKEKTTKRDIMLDYIKQKKEASLADLRRKFAGDRRAIHYNLPILYDDGEIRCFLKGNGLKDEDIIYVVVNDYEYPQDVKKLIDEMRVPDINIAMQKMKNFIYLCETRSIPDEMSRKLAFLLMSDMKPGLKERISFELAYNKDRVKREGKGGLMSTAHVRIEDILIELGLEPPIFIDSPDFPRVSVKDFDDGKDD